MPVTGYVLYEFLPVEEMQNVAEAVLRVFHKLRRLRAPAAQPDEVRGASSSDGRRSGAKVMEELEAFVADRRRAARRSRPSS